MCCIVPSETLAQSPVTDLVLNVNLLVALPESRTVGVCACVHVCVRAHVRASSTCLYLSRRGLISREQKHGSALLHECRSKSSCQAPLRALLRLISPWPLGDRNAQTSPLQINKLCFRRLFTDKHLLSGEKPLFNKLLLRDLSMQRAFLPLL